MNNQRYINEIVLDEINDSIYSELVPNTDSLGIYMCRIWYNNEYVYKIGKTAKNLSNRLQDINEHFNSKRRMILIFYGKTTNVNAEEYIHRELKKYQYPDTSKPKSKELYYISPNVYDAFKKELIKYTDNYFFETEKYRINDDNIEYYQICNEYIEYYINIVNFYDKEIKYIELDRRGNGSEEQYWFVNEKLIKLLNEDQDFIVDDEDSIEKDDDEDSIEYDDEDLIEDDDEDLIEDDDEDLIEDDDEDLIEDDDEDLIEDDEEDSIEDDEEDSIEKDDKINKIENYYLINNIFLILNMLLMIYIYVQFYNTIIKCNIR